MNNSSVLFRFTSAIQRSIFICLSIFFAISSASGQQIFDTPQQAAAALSQAADTENPASFIPVFGAPFTQQIGSGDAQADKLGVQRLGTLMRQGYEFSQEDSNTIYLKVGADKFRFPLPIARTTSGKWAFNVKAGKEALLKLRMDRNEERVIKIAEFYATAQNQYKKMTGMYAAKFRGKSSTKDGLYWETGPDGIVSPLEPLVARVENLGYQRQGRESPILTGYNFRVLTAQGEYAPGKSQSYIDANGRMTKGFAMIAYPARYGVSGKMSFLVGSEALVYQRDLGTETEALASKITRFDPDPSWSVIGGDIKAPPKKMRYINSGSAYPFYSDY